MNNRPESSASDITTARLPYVDGLRGISILAVVLHHAFERQFPSGYLGVDVFFVISGFVITKQLSEFPFQSRSHFLLSFYRRRICRLLPALIVVTVVTALAYAAVTFRSQDALWTAAWTLAGLANLYLYISAQDYFALDASLNPLTHMWSLGVEEQFYLVYPALMLAAGLPADTVRRERLKTVLLLIIAVSLPAYLVFTFLDPIAAFYLTPFRLWELALGAFAYVTAKEAKRNRFTPFVQMAALAGVIALLLFPERMVLLTPLVCSATASVLWMTRAGDRVSWLLTNRALTHLGAISYSLYLWHWPVLVMGRDVFGHGTAVLVCLLIVTYLVSLWSCRQIEERFRHPPHAQRERTVVLGTLGFDALAIYTIAGLTLLRPHINVPALFGIAEAQTPTLECHGPSLRDKRDALLDCLEPRRTPATPKAVFLVGDSHAAHFYWMVEGATAGSAYDLRFLNSDAVDGFPSLLMAAARAVEPKSLGFVLSRAEPGDVVVVAFFRGLLNDERMAHVPLSEPVAPNAKTHNLITNFGPFVERLERRGVAVVLVRDTPMMRHVANASSCALQVKLLGSSSCRVDQAQDRHTRWRQDFAFDTLAGTYRNVRVFDPSPFLFGDNNSYEIVDNNGAYLMSDWNHISALQSEKLAVPFRNALRTWDLAGGRR